MSTLQAVVFDWAGTMIDHGSRAPMGVFVKTFAQFGVEISVDEARVPMGMAKRDHVSALINAARIVAAWEARHGAPPSEADIDRLYEVFLPMNAAAVTDFADLIDGAADTAREIRARGLKIGSTTGYTREIMERLLPVAAGQGYAPDNLVCTGDTPAGRPSPMMMYRCFLDLGVWPAWSVVKVDDTEVGIAQGLNAGSWTVGVALSGNVFGLGPAETDALAADDFAARRTAAYGKLNRAGAHFVIDSVADLPEILDEIEGALARGERP
jgi:phosphonoacetaldehyde hydrolase